MKKTTINYIRFKQELLQLNKIALRPLPLTTTDQVALCIVYSLNIFLQRLLP